MRAIEKKNIATMLVLLYLGGCSSAMNPFYNRHPQYSQSFSERRPPANNLHAEKGGYAKKKSVDPFDSQQSELSAMQQGLIGDMPQQPQAPYDNMPAPSVKKQPVQTKKMEKPLEPLAEREVMEHLMAADLEQGSGDYGYSFYDLANDIDADELANEDHDYGENEVVDALQPVLPAGKNIIKAQHLDDLPQLSHSSPYFERDKRVNIPFMQRLNSQKNDENSSKPLSDQELDEFNKKNYRELNGVPKVAKEENS